MLVAILLASAGVGQAMGYRAGATGACHERDGIHTSDSCRDAGTGRQAGHGHGYTIGASGQCYQNDGSGGSFSTGISTHGEDGAPSPSFNPPETGDGGAVDAVSSFAYHRATRALHPTPWIPSCSAPEEGPSGEDQRDYFEAHIIDGVFVQACYEDGSGPSLEGGCPTEPGGFPSE